MDAAILLALTRQPGSSPRRIRALLEWSRQGDHALEPMCGAPIAELLNRLPSGFDDTARLLSTCDEGVIDTARRHVNRAIAAGAQPIALIDPDYPAALRDTLQQDAPPLLFVAGDSELLRGDNVAIVGARKGSAQGPALARACAQLASAWGACVVSGAAPGVDEAAHEAALHAGGRTALILPQGILTFRASRACHEAVDEGRAAIVSAWPPNQPWSKPAALGRNAMIVALAKLTCVIGPRDGGGSWHSAGHALNFRRPAFVWCEEEYADVLASLQRQGAEALTDEDDTIRREALWEAWSAEASSAGAQAELL